MNVKFQSTQSVIRMRLILALTSILLLAGSFLVSARATEANTDAVTQLGLGWYWQDGRNGTSLQNTNQALTNGDQIGFETQLFNSINAARTARGLAPVKVHNKLRTSARVCATDGPDEPFQCD